jgi:hypothetical protein
MTDQPEQITIDAEFQNLIRPLSDQERKELRESLSICGLLSPLIIWKHEGKTILVDGHNRLSLWREYNGFNDEYELKTQELFFGNRDNAKEWIIKNQLGRRNLSPDDFRLLVGMLYNQRKKVVPNPDGIGGKSGKIVMDHNDPQQKSDKTAAAVAAETGVSPATVKRAGKLAAKVEEIKQAEPELPRQEVITKAKEIIAEAAPKPEPPKRSLDELLAERWNRFIKDIPVTDHTAVRLWVTAKLKEAAL